MGRAGKSGMMYKDLGGHVNTLGLFPLVPILPVFPVLPALPVFPILY
jgi:hypothetical protein